ncbi:INO80 complex subunit B like [Actinidia chinensis var. chinensis]|uniref:INO80 complex subunit B like n=1 Tax=Actinidia chinensis var. chinensis TaxID=1590841 RepID=A0A2R6QD91_ACTCC|nr:INO80 complex subunit B like [Actinidia chinensis var. chinensis]
MEEFRGPRFESIGNTIRKKRSQTSRRPRPESLQFAESLDRSPMSSTPPSDDVCKNSSDEITGGDTSSRRKLFNLNQCALRDTTSRAGEYPHKKIKKDGSSYGYGDLEDSVDKGGRELNNKQCSEGVFGPANWKSTNKTKRSFEMQSTTADINGESQSSWHSRVNGHGAGNDTNLKKVKLKVGGVTRTIQTKSNSHAASGSGSSTKDSRTSDAPRSQHKMILQDNSDDDDPPPLVKKSFMRGIPWKDFSGRSSDLGTGKMPEKNSSANRGEKSVPVRKSKRVPKKRVLDREFDDEDEDDEIRYLEKLKISKVAAGSKDFEEESSKKQQRITRVSKSTKHDEILEDFVNSRSSKDGKKKSQSERGSEDTDYDDDEELMSDGEPGGKKKKKPRNDSIDSPTEKKRALGLTTRQRALLSSKDASSVSGTSVVEFPNGLPPAPSRKQKEKLSEVEQQLKKAEAAQRRRMQVEKAARESEAEAIKKILGQDSSRKKREDKIKKRQEEMAQERAANALVLASNTIRLVMGPTGTVVTFSKDMGLPNIFNPKPHSYPPPREKCAGPSCTNPYKYRDSKSKLPLCSLHCYKVINEKMETETTS